MKGGLYQVYQAERHEHNRLAANRRNEDIARQRQSETYLPHAGKNRLTLTNQEVASAQKRLLYTSIFSISLIFGSAGLLVVFFVM